MFSAMVCLCALRYGVLVCLALWFVGVFKAMPLVCLTLCLWCVYYVFSCLSVGGRRSKYV